MEKEQGIQINISTNAFLTEGKKRRGGGGEREREKKSRSRLNPNKVPAGSMMKDRQSRVGEMKTKNYSVSEYE